MRRVFSVEFFKLAIIRLFAFMLDWYISTLITEIPVLFFQSVNGKDLVLYNSLENLQMSQAIIATILAILLYIGYYCWFPLKKNGQTLARKLLHLEVTRVDGKELEFKNLFLRDVVGVFLLQGTLTSINIYCLSLVQMFFKSSIVPYFYTVYYLVMIISIIMFCFSKEHRMIQDRISRTKTQITPPIK